MKSSMLFAALLAVAMAGCSKKEDTSPYSLAPQTATKPQPGGEQKAEPAKVVAPAGAQTPAVAATSSSESKPAEAGGAKAAGGEAKPAEQAAPPAGGEPGKKEKK